MRTLAVIVRTTNLRHLLGHGLRTALTTVGIAAGVALVFSISVINTTLLTSFRSSIQNLAGAAELEVAAADQVGIRESHVEKIAAVPGVERAVPVTRSNTLVEGPDGSRRVMILGITPEFVSLFPRGLGSLARVRVSGGFSGPRDAILSKQVATELGLGDDSSFTAETPRGGVRLRMSGTISGGSLAALNGGYLGVMLLPSAQQVFDKTALVDSIYVVVDTGSSTSDVQRAIESIVDDGAIVGAPGERGDGVERVFGGLADLLSLAGTVALFVALFVVFNTMSMSLAERRREISMAMALGAERRHMFGAFLAEAGVVGVIASACGVAGGLLLARLLVVRAVEGYQLLPVQVGGPLVIRPSHVAVAAISGIAVSLLGAYIPARRVLRVAPIEALRPEASYEWSPSTSPRGHRARAAAGATAFAIATVAFMATGSRPDEGWIVQVGLVSGLTAVTLLLPYVVPLAVRILRPLMRAGLGTVGRLAADALGKNPGRTTFTVASLVLTLGLVIGVGSALGSYQTQIERQASALIGAPIYVTARSFTGITSDQPLPADLGARLSEVEGVQYVYPLRFLFLDVEGEQGLMFAVPVEEALEHGADTHTSAITEDPEAYLRTLSEGGVAVSIGTARRHDLEVGDRLSLKTPDGARDFEVGAFYNDLVSFDSLYIDYEHYRQIWRDDNVDQFGVLIEPGADVHGVRGDLQTLVEDTGAPAKVLLKEEVIGDLLETIQGTFELGQGIQLAALVVAAITIANTMFTAVLERRWEMGLQRALGMDRRQLARSVLLEAAAIGLIGGIGGAILGTASGIVMLESMEAQFAWNIPFQAPVLQWLLAVTGGMALAAAVGAVPSRMAARGSIIGSLRYE
ncbi:MAG TPA: FtsX-like permease family protein [Actinomycetota bacterium]|nr:FtsX-like permease family protein [Actinomycetota bacterium]